MDRITTIISTGSVYCNAVELTHFELEEKKAELKADALKFLEVYSDFNIVYAHDDISDDGHITKSWLYYSMFPVSDEDIAEKEKDPSVKVHYVSNRRLYH